MTKTNSLITKLRYVLRLNASSCLFFGIAFVAYSSEISGLIGNPSPSILAIIGVGLVINGFHLIAASCRQSLKLLEIAYFVFGDLVWVLATLVLVGLGLGISTTIGIVSSLVIGAMVGSFGFLQAKYGRRACQEGLVGPHTFKWNK